MKIKVMCERHQCAVAPSDPSGTDALRMTPTPYVYEFDTSEFECLVAARELAEYEFREAEYEPSQEAIQARMDQYTECADEWYFEVEGITKYGHIQHTFHVR